MGKQNKSVWHSSRTFWMGTLTLGTGLVVASSAALAAPLFLGAPAQSAPAAQSQAKSDPYPQLPEGPGKQTVVRVCGKCHSPTNVIANGQNQQGWEDTITKMAEVSYNLPHMWNHAIGLDWKDKITLDTIKDLFKRL